MVDANPNAMMARDTSTGHIYLKNTTLIENKNTPT